MKKYQGKIRLVNRVEVGVRSVSDRIEEKKYNNWCQKQRYKQQERDREYNNIIIIVSLIQV